MKKLLSLISAGIIWAVMVFPANSAGLGFGVTASIYNVEADGTETDENDVGTESSVRNASVDNTVAMGSLYTEIASERGWAIGLEYTPGSADVSSSIKTRTDTELSVTDTATTTSTSRDFKANAEVDNYMVTYIEMPLFSSFYARLGYAEVDLNTTEVASGNGGNYGNTTLDGINYGVGLKGVTDNNFVWKTSYEVTDFDGFSLTSSGNSTDSGSNTITADVDTWAVKLSLGYQF